MCSISAAHFNETTIVTTVGKKGKNRGARTRL